MDLRKFYFFGFRMSVRSFPSYSGDGGNGLMIHMVSGMESNQQYWVYTINALDSVAK